MIPNLCKKEKWPMLIGYKDSWNNNTADTYFVYKLTKKEKTKYLNTWFKGGLYKSKDELFTYRDEMIILKECDKDTIMYNEKYNPVELVIQCPIGAKFATPPLYNMRCSIRSIDDSSYTIWFENKPIEELYQTRLTIMNWINWQKKINGEAFLEYCKELGADEDSINYD